MAFTDADGNIITSVDGVSTGGGQNEQPGVTIVTSDSSLIGTHFLNSDPGPVTKIEIDDDMDIMDGGHGKLKGKTHFQTTIFLQIEDGLE